MPIPHHLEDIIAGLNSAGTSAAQMDFITNHARAISEIIHRHIPGPITTQLVRQLFGQRRFPLYSALLNHLTHTVLQNPHMHQTQFASTA